jgi:hypothetical protein
MDTNEFPFQRLTDRQSIAAAVKHINESVNGCGFDFREDTNGRYVSYGWANFEEPNRLVVLASFDFAYYYDLEILFFDVSCNEIPDGYSWWDHWTKDQLELLDKDDPNGFEFRFNIGTHGDQYFTVVAKGFSYLFKRVSHRR